MSGVLMKCGHIAQGINAKTGKPTCLICVGLTPDAEIVDDAPPSLLEGRMAECCYSHGRDGRPCKKKVPSSYSLPFFEHRPDKETDQWYCGCWGWD